MFCSVVVPFINVGLFHVVVLTLLASIGDWSPWRNWVNHSNCWSSSYTARITSHHMRNPCHPLRWRLRMLSHFSVRIILTKALITRKFVVEVLRLCWCWPTSLHSTAKFVKITYSCLDRSLRMNLEAYSIGQHFLVFLMSRILSFYYIYLHLLILKSSEPSNIKPFTIFIVAYVPSRSFLLQSEEKFGHLYLLV